jgi:FixJ family two-component response regulator
LIAVIDDDDEFRMALVESLYLLGYCADGFASAEQFVGEGEEASYDCIITDIRMPRMSGFDLKKQLTDRGVTVPVIMITSRAEIGLEARAVGSGAVCLLRKPFETDTLAAFIKRALGAE